MVCRMFHGKCGQAATEYVHTYGWVFMSALVLGGALIYFNLNESRDLVPQGCRFLSGIGCIDMDVEEDLLSIAIVNEFGFTISNITANITGTCNSTANTSEGNPYSNPNVMLANDQDSMTFVCQNLTKLRLEEKIAIGFRVLETGEPHVKMGRLHYSPVGNN